MKYTTIQSSAPGTPIQWLPQKEETLKSVVLSFEAFNLVGDCGCDWDCESSTLLDKVQSFFTFPLMEFLMEITDSKEL